MRLPFVRGAVNKKAIEAFAEGETNTMLPPEYASLDYITEHKWEATRGIGRSFA